ncbi:MAG: ankyrin repeat domain-containing protein [bacterium]
MKIIKNILLVVGLFLGASISFAFSATAKKTENPNAWVPTGPTREDIEAGNFRSHDMFEKRDRWKELKVAIEKNDLTKVKDLIVKGVDLEVTDYFGNTALMMAAKNGYADIVSELINAGAEIGTAMYTMYANGETALFYACNGGHTETAIILINKGAAKKEQNLEHLFTSAMAEGHRETVITLINKGAAKDEKNLGSLFTSAVFEGDNEMVKALIDGGAIFDRFTIQIASMSQKCSVEIMAKINNLPPESVSN